MTHSSSGDKMAVQDVSWSLCPLVFVGAIALRIVFGVWPVVLVLYEDVFIGNLTQLRLDAFFLWC
jgi:hypothetical protein